MTAVITERTEAPRTRRSKALRRFASDRLAVGAAVVIPVLVLVAILAPWLSPYGPAQVSFTELTAPPSPTHLFGTDNLGRDVFTRILYGGRVSLSAGILSVTAALVIGTFMGLLAGYFGGWVDEVLMRLVDALLALPFLVLAITLAAVLGASLQNAMLAITVATIPTFARIARGEVLAALALDYVQAGRAIGASNMRVLFRHILPNAAGPIIVQISLSIANAVLTESSLSFLGLGVQPPTPSWGSMLNVARGYLATAPWLALFPGIALFVTVLSFSLVGEGLRAAMDPRGGLRRP